MANIFTQNPISLDTVWTAGTIPAALTALTSPQVFSRIVWASPVSVGDQLVLTDINGNILFSTKCSVANQDVVLWEKPDQKYTFKQGKWVLLTRTSGTLLLYK